MANSINVNAALVFQCSAILLSGLLAGLMYGYDCSVVKGLAKLPDEQYVQAFRSFNTTIQNPYFMLSFMGSLLVLPVATWVSYHQYNSLAFYLLLSASLLYFIGVFGVTIGFNVPLNERLDNFPLLNATTEDISAVRKAFEKPWNKYHTIRTVASIISFLLAILSLVKQKI